MRLEKQPALDIEVGEMFAAQCRAARALLNWTQADIAKAAGCSEQLVRKYEKDGPRSGGATAMLRDAFEQAGIRFPINDDGFGVMRLK
jgi:transcriptional regulator with XRE-family HTH domain